MNSTRINSRALTHLLEHSLLIPPPASQCSKSCCTAPPTNSPKAATRAALSLLLGVDVDDETTVAELTALTRTHWHGIVGIPLKLGIPGVSFMQSKRSLAAGAADKLRANIAARYDAAGSAAAAATTPTAKTSSTSSISTPTTTAHPSSMEGAPSGGGAGLTSSRDPTASTSSSSSASGVCPVGTAGLAHSAVREGGESVFDGARDVLDREETIEHTLLFISALIPKAIAAMLTQVSQS